MKVFSSPLREVPDVLLCGVVLQQAHQETQGLLGGVHGAAGHHFDVLRRVPATAKKVKRKETKMNKTSKTEFLSVIAAQERRNGFWHRRLPLTAAAVHISVTTT